MTIYTEIWNFAFFSIFMPPLGIFRKFQAFQINIFSEYFWYIFTPEIFRSVASLLKKLIKFENGIFLRFAPQNWPKIAHFYIFWANFNLPFDFFCFVLKEFNLRNAFKVIGEIFLTYFRAQKDQKLPFFTIFDDSANRYPQGGSTNFGLLELKIVQNGLQ